MIGYRWAYSHTYKNHSARTGDYWLEVMRTVDGFLPRIHTTSTGAKKTLPLTNTLSEAKFALESAVRAKLGRKASRSTRQIVEA